MSRALRLLGLSIAAVFASLLSAPLRGASLELLEDPSLNVCLLTLGWLMLGVLAVSFAAFFATRLGFAYVLLGLMPALICFFLLHGPSAATFLLVLGVIISSKLISNKEDVRRAARRAGKSLALFLVVAATLALWINQRVLNNVLDGFVDWGVQLSLPLMRERVSEELKASLGAVFRSNRMAVESFTAFLAASKPELKGFLQEKREEFLKTLEQELGKQLLASYEEAQLQRVNETYVRSIFERVLRSEVELKGLGKSDLNTTLKLLILLIIAVTLWTVGNLAASLVAWLASLLSRVG